MSEAIFTAGLGLPGLGPIAAADMLAARPAVLVVDDDAAIRMIMADTLRDAGFDVVEAADAADAARLLQQRRDFQVMVTDIHMPGATNGYFLARQVRERWPYVEVLMVSGQALPARRDLDLDCDVLCKPFAGIELVGRVAALARRAAEPEIGGGLVAGSPPALRA